MVKLLQSLVIGMWLVWAGSVAAESISDTDMALGYYLPLAEQGEPYAQLTIGEIFMEGAGIEQDLVSAYAWFYVSFKQGVPEAEAIMNHVYGQLSAEDQVVATELAQEYLKAYGNSPY